MRPLDPSTIALERASGTPLYRQIADALRRQVLDGTLRSGDRLPPERRLAQALGVNRTTVVSAYNELLAEGLVERHVGRGTSVAGQRRSGASTSDEPVEWRRLFVRGVEELAPWQYSVADALAAPGIVGTTCAEPLPDLLPVRELGRFATELLEERGSEVLRVAPVEGVPRLRAAVARRLAQRGAELDATNVLVTAGGQQAIDLLARALVEAGDVVAIESPTYMGAVRAFQQRGARLVGVPMDENGMRVDVLEQVLARWPVKLVFVTPNFSNPTGAVLSADRRRQLLAVTRRYQVPVVEDDVFGELQFEGDTPPCLISAAPSDHVIHLSGMSKTLSAGLRVGWIAAAGAVIERVAGLKQVSDLFTGTLNQWLALRAIESGLVERHLIAMRPLYRERRDALIGALGRHCGAWLATNRPPGGIVLWCRLAEGLRASDLLTEAYRAGVTFVPGEAFSADGGWRSYLRFSYGPLSHEEIEVLARRLATAMESVHARQSPARTTAGATPLV